MSDFASKLTELLTSATKEDLDKVEEEIARVKSDALNRVRTLEQSRSILQRALGVETKDQRKHRKRKEGEKYTPPPPSNNRGWGEGAAAARKTAALTIAKEGAMQPAALTSILGMPHGRVEQVMKHEWFEKTHHGYILTPAGRQANC